jgi:hypothetical protein
MSDKQIMIGLWAGLICLVPILVFGLYQERSEYSKQCAEANGTLIATKTDYICVKTKAIIPLDK